MANAPIVVAEGDDEIEVDYDSDGNPIVSEKSRVIDPLPPLDHSAVRKEAWLMIICNLTLFCPLD